MAPKVAIQRIQRQILPILLSHGVSRAGLFGSAARGEMRRGSDIDILVKTSKGTSLMDFVGIKLALEQKLKRRVDLVEYGTIKRALRENIMRDHVSVL